MIHKYVLISSPQHPHEVDAIIVHCTDEEIELTQPFSVRAGTTDSSDPHSVPLRAVLEGAIFLYLVTRCLSTACR